MVGNLLGAVLSRLRHGPLDLKKHLVIRRARIPIIKVNEYMIHYTNSFSIYLPALFCP